MDKPTRRCFDRRLASSGESFLLAQILLACLLAGGCASGGARIGHEPAPPHYVAAAETETPLEPTVVGYPEPHDPLMPLNRAVFAFNDIVYRYALVPLSKGYQRAVPDPVRATIANFFDNLKTPIYLVNHLLQGEPAPAGKNLLRFGINTTLGLFGLFDPATSVFDLEREQATFEDTLARYGSGPGVYLVLPLFGPSDTRNGISRVVDYYLHPLAHVEDPDPTALRSFGYFQEYAPEAERYEVLRRKSEDPYIFFRNLYLQGKLRDVEY